MKKIFFFLKITCLDVDVLNDTTGVPSPVCISLKTPLTPSSFTLSVKHTKTTSSCQGRSYKHAAGADASLAAVFDPQVRLDAARLLGVCTYLCVHFFAACL